MEEYVKYIIFYLKTKMTNSVSLYDYKIRVLILRNNVNYIKTKTNNSKKCI